MTPQEHARTYPFLNNSRLTPQDEAWVAAHMYRTVIAERIRHRKAENVDRAKANRGPTHKRNTQPMIDRSRAAVAEKGRAKREQILKIIGTGAMSIREVHKCLPKPIKGTEGSLADMMRGMKRGGYLSREIRQRGTIGTGYWSRTGKEME